MLCSLLVPTLAFVAAASAAPATDPNKPLGNAWADITQCAYTIKAGHYTTDPGNNGNIAWDSPKNYVGSIMEYNTTAGFSVKVISALAQVNTAERWEDSYTTHRTKLPFVPGSGIKSYAFAGTFQPTVANPSPQLSIWGPQTENKHVQLPIDTPDLKTEAKENRGSRLCLGQWSIPYLKSLNTVPDADVVNYRYCITNQYGGKFEDCPDFYSSTYSFYNLPVPL